MSRIFIFFLFITLFTAPAGIAKEKDKDVKTASEKNSGSETKELSGMSIVGNDEAPKSLYIVPWKSSEIGLETSLSMALKEKDAPVDRDVFKRKLEFYEISNKK
jgi:hypothetical protein